MGKFKLQVQVTVDGYMAGPEGEMDWLTFSWSDDLNAYVEGLMASVDHMVLGRVLAEGFIPAWEAGPEGEGQASIDWMNNTPKTVVSRTLTSSPWKNATIAEDDLTEAVTRLKNRPGGDLITYGGVTLVHDLITAGLLDDLYLFVNPVAIGNGMPVFPDTGAKQPLRLVEARSFDCGITALHYQPQR